MKNLLPLFLLFSIVYTSCNPENDSKNNLEYVVKNFENPPVDYRSAPFWVWHGDVTKDDIDYQLSDMEQTGIGGAFLHARTGLKTEYLSEEWFDLVEFAVERGKELGIHIWLYDENAFPSGYAGGLLGAEMEDSYKHGQGLEMVLIESSKDFDFSEFHLIVEKNEEGFRVISDDDLQSVQGDLLGFIKVYNEARGRYGNYPYPDLLIEGVTEKFIEITMSGYEERVGSEFGRSIPGIFTDEPHIRQPGSTREGSFGTIRYTPDLYNQFESRWGYDLRNHLPSLFDDVGNWKQVRHNYRQLLLEMFTARWGQPWFDYTEEHNLHWTGHYWEHTWPDPGHLPDNMAIYAYKQMPGIDLLFNTPEERPNQFGHVRNVKEVRSAANQTGRKRVLSETYGASGWELGFEDLKRHGDWMYALGINFMNEHMYFGTLLGARKRDFPQSISYHAPWWKHYNVLTNHFARLSLALSAGEQINSTLVLEPTTSTWLHHTTSNSNELRDEIADQFHNFLDELELQQLEYDLGSEYIIRKFGSVANGALVVGERSYQRVILPPGTSNLNSETADLIEQYLADGSEIYDLSGIPHLVDGLVSTRISDLADEYSSQWKTYSSLNSELIGLLSESDFQVFDSENYGGKVFHHRRQLEDGQIIFWTNWSNVESAIIDFSIDGASVELMNLLDGSIQPVHTEKDGNNHRFAFKLPPTQSKLFLVRNEHTANTSDKIILETEGTVAENIVEPQSDFRIERLQPNVLVIDYTDLKVADREEKGIYFYDAANLVFSEYGFEQYGFGYNPWNVSVQYKTNILDMDSLFTPESSFTADYRFYVDDEGLDENLKAVIEQSHLYEISINGSSITATEGEWWLDRAFDVIEIGTYVQPGENMLTLHINPISIHAELEPVYLLGDFDLISNDQGFRITSEKPLEFGPWNQQGLSMYGHDVAYSTDFNLDEVNGQYFVELDEWQGTVAEILVNGTSAGIIGWQPYRLDVTGYIESGENRVEVIVTGSLKNTLGPHHNNPQTGFATPWSFFFAPENQPAGEEYSTLPYGLFEPFRLVNVR